MSLPITKNVNKPYWLTFVSPGMFLSELPRNLTSCVAPDWIDGPIFVVLIEMMNMDALSREIKLIGWKFCSAEPLWRRVPKHHLSQSDTLPACSNQVSSAVDAR